MQSRIDAYKANGYHVLRNAPSSIGSTILVNAAVERVIKFSQDPAYDKFVQYAVQNPHPALPVIFKHEAVEPDSVSSGWYTITDMEYLDRLSDDEATRAEEWIKRVIDALRSGTPTDKYNDDPFELLGTILNLRKVAQLADVCLDVLKASNYMARVSGETRRLVVTDPFN